MTFQSILTENVADGTRTGTVDEPVFLADLNLDQIVKSVTGPKQEYSLEHFFYTPLRDAETIRYRQEVMQDLEDETLMAHIKAFAQDMIIVRRYLQLVTKLDFPYHKKGWFLEAALVYCDAVARLARDLGSARVGSRGLVAFREYLAGYAGSPGFQSLQAEAREVKAALSDVRYCVNIQNSRVRVRKYEGEIDYSVEVEKAFEKFAQGAATDYRLDLYRGSGMNHIEAQILDLVARLYPEPFAALDQFCAHHEQFVEETMRAFDREIQYRPGHREHN